MEELKVKTISKPERCEICHTTDYFDAEKNECARCSEALPAGIPLTEEEKLFRQRRQQRSELRVKICSSNCC
jgi:hypothetical protein